MLNAALSTNENYLLKLYNSNITPLNNTSSGTFAGHTATFTNYAPVTLTRSNWASAVQSGNAASSTYNTQQSFTCGATGDTVYGYWVEGATSNVVLWAELFGTARTLANGDILNLTPVTRRSMHLSLEMAA